METVAKNGGYKHGRNRTTGIGVFVTFFKAYWESSGEDRQLKDGVEIGN